MLCCSLSKIIKECDTIDSNTKLFKLKCVQRRLDIVENDVIA